MQRNIKAGNIGYLFYGKFCGGLVLINKGEGIAICCKYLVMAQCIGYGVVATAGTNEHFFYRNGFGGIVYRATNNDLTYGPISCNTEAGGNTKYFDRIIQEVWFEVYNITLTYILSFIWPAF